MILRIFSSWYLLPIIWIARGSPSEFWHADLAILPSCNCQLSNYSEHLIACRKIWKTYPSLEIGMTVIHFSLIILGHLGDGDNSSWEIQDVCHHISAQYLRGKTTKQSLGYWYINHATELEASPLSINKHLYKEVIWS